MLTLMAHYRPTKTGDGFGGFTETLAGPTELWGSLTVHEGRVELVFQSGPDLRPEDVLVVASQYYRVLSIVGHTMGPAQKAIIEATEKPIFP